MIIEPAPAFPPHPDAPKVNAPPPSLVAPVTPPTHEIDGPEPLLETVAGRFPDFVKEPIFNVLQKVNKVLFRSHPAGEPQPVTPGSWTFAAIGDYGSGSRAQSDVADRILERKPDLVVTLGDNIYWNGAEENWREKWDPPQFWGKVRSSVPVMPSLGNHDIEDTGPGAYFRRFPELNGARYYSYEHKGVHFTALDSNESLAPGSPQADWLDQNLGEAHDARWKVVYFHHPMYSPFTARDGKLRDALAPVMAKHGVNLVLVGHDHNYERTKPLNDKGTVHALVGAGGHTVYPFLVPQPQWSAYRTPEWGHLNVEVTDDRLVGRYILRDGSVRDTFVLSGRQAVSDAATAAAAASDVPAVPATSDAPVG